MLWYARDASTQRFLDTEVIVVDTTDFKAVDYDAITERVRASVLQP